MSSEPATHSSKSSSLMILFVIFQVSDTGIGISPAEQEHVFEVFKQADGSTSRSFDGTGLGLAISHRLCLGPDGEITVRSLPPTRLYLHDPAAADVKSMQATT